MHSTIRESLNKISPVWGVCDYATLQNHLLPCAAQKRIPYGATSIIVALFPYYLGEDATANANVSRYAVAADYHDIVLARLNEAVQKLQAEFPLESFAAFVDNSPIPEVAAAANAGLGVVGENTLLINPDYGSWVFIGEIVTTLQIDTVKSTGLHRCIGCGKCVAACPAGILGRLTFDKTKCLSQITQSKGDLTLAQTKLIKAGGCAWGCDICQTVCPMNNNAVVTPLEPFKNDLRKRVKAGDDLNGRAYAWRGRAVIERNLKILQGQ